MTERKRGPITVRAEEGSKEIDLPDWSRKWVAAVLELEGVPTGGPVDGDGLSMGSADQVPASSRSR